jgi:hypothetical protein
MQHEVTIDERIAARACLTVERMLAVK